MCVCVISYVRRRCFKKEKQGVVLTALITIHDFCMLVNENFQDLVELIIEYT